jgi:hypothetical protein
MPAPGTPIGGGGPKGYQQITLTGTATGLTVPAGATVAYCIVEVATARWRDDGTAPTTALGMLVPIGGSVTFEGKLSAVQVIAVSGSPTLNVSYY